MSNAVSPPYSYIVSSDSSRFEITLDREDRSDLLSAVEQTIKAENKKHSSDPNMKVAFRIILFHKDIGTLYFPINLLNIDAHYNYNLQEIIDYVYLQIIIPGVEKRFSSFEDYHSAVEENLRIENNLSALLKMILIARTINRWFDQIDAEDLNKFDPCGLSIRLEFSVFEQPLEGEPCQLNLNRDREGRLLQLNSRYLKPFLRHYSSTLSEVRFERFYKVVDEMKSLATKILKAKREITKISNCPPPLEMITECTRIAETAFNTLKESAKEAPRLVARIYKFNPTLPDATPLALMVLQQTLAENPSIKWAHEFSQRDIDVKGGLVFGPDIKDLVCDLEDIQEEIERLEESTTFSNREALAQYTKAAQKLEQIDNSLSKSPYLKEMIRLYLRFNHDLAVCEHVTEDKSVIFDLPIILEIKEFVISNHKHLDRGSHYLLNLVKESIQEFDLKSSHLRDLGLSELDKYLASKKFPEPVRQENIPPAHLGIVTSRSNVASGTGPIGMEKLAPRSIIPLIRVSAEKVPHRL